MILQLTQQECTRRGYTHRTKHSEKPKKKKTRYDKAQDIMESNNSMSVKLQMLQELL
jgi:hypothetical protein